MEARKILKFKFSIEIENSFEFQFSKNCKLN